MAIPDALRAFAILGVVLHHIVSFSHVTIDHRRVPTDYLGVWGVNMFFVLSGFLLTAEYVRAIFEEKPFPNTRSFLGRRFLRIYPLYFAVVVLDFVLVSAFLRPISWPVIFRHLLMLQATSIDSVSAVNFPLWTMGVDACFYLALPLLMAAVYLTTRRANRLVKALTLSGALLAIIVSTIVFRSFETFRHASAVADYKIDTVYIRNFFGMGSAFALGIAIVVIDQLVPKGRLKPRIFQMAVVCGAAIAVAAFLTRPLMHGVIEQIVEDPVAATSCALILFGLINGGAPVISRIAETREVGFAATLAYAIYLIHSPILEVFWIRVLRTKPGTLALVELAIVFIIVIVPLAILANRLIEEPFLKIKNRLRTTSSPSYRRI